MWTATIDGKLIRPVLSVKKPTLDNPLWVIRTPTYTYTASNMCKVIIKVDECNTYEQGKKGSDINA